MIGGPITNKVQEWLYYVAIITMVVGVAAGVVVGSTLEVPIPGYSYIAEPHPLRWVYGVSLIVSSLVSGLIFIAFSEIIGLLDRIHKQLAQRPQQKCNLDDKKSGDVGGG